METAFIQAMDAALLRLVRARRTDRVTAQCRTELRDVLGAIPDYDRHLDVDSLAEVAAALMIPVVHDVMFRVVLTCHSLAAERMWSELTRLLPDPARAEGAVLLAVSGWVEDVAARRRPSLLPTGGRPISGEDEPTGLIRIQYSPRR